MNFNGISQFIKRMSPYLLAAAIVACTETIDVNFPEEDTQLVVYSLFHPDSVWQVEVSASKNLNTPATPYPVINEATVEIYQENKLIDILEYQGYLDPETVIDMTHGITYDTVFWRKETIYRSQEGIRPEPGVAYTVRVSAPGYPSVEATDRIPVNPLIELKEVNFDQLTHQPGFNQDDQYLEVSSVIHDLPDQNDYYLAGASYTAFELHSKENNLYDTIPYQQYMHVEVIDLQSIRLQDLKLFSDQSFYGITYPVKLGIGLDYLFTIENTDSLVLHLGTVSEAFYRYYETLDAQKRYGVGIVNLTDPPKVYSNVEGGLGVFAGYNTIDFPIYRIEFK